MVDTHTHSTHSPDGRQTLGELCEAALAAGLDGVTVTDHVDLWFYEETQAKERLLACAAEAERLKQVYDGRLRLYVGVEMAEALSAPEKAREAARLVPFDCILGSVHSVRYDTVTETCSHVDFSERAMSGESVMGYLNAYYEKMTEMAEQTDIDALAHLTYPFRYINGRYGRSIDLSRLDEAWERVLSVIIKRRIALEVNTSGFETSFDEWMPPEAILKRYYRMGGRLVTLGSDAHSPERVGKGFSKAAEMLKGIGFTYCVYFEQRQMREIAL